MMRYFEAVLDDGITRVQVEYEVISYGSFDSWTEPGDPVEIEVQKYVDDGGEGSECEPSEQEKERIEQQICEAVWKDGPTTFDDDF